MCYFSDETLPRCQERNISTEQQYGTFYFFLLTCSAISSICREGGRIFLIDFKAIIG